MKTKSSLSILVIAVAVVGFIAISANEETSAQPYARGHCLEGGSCGTATSSQSPMRGGGRGAGRGWGRGGGMGGHSPQFAQEQAGSDCDSCGHSGRINGGAAGGCGNRGLVQHSGCSSDRGGRGSRFSHDVAHRSGGGCGSTGGQVGGSRCSSGRAGGDG